MKTIQINGCDFDIHDGPIGLALSGGADSAIMLYVLMFHAPGPIHIFTCANKLKQRTNSIIAHNVISKLLDHIHRDDVYHHNFFVEKQTFESLFHPLYRFISDYKLDVIYTAGTALPPDQDLWDKQKFSTDCGLYEKRNQNTRRPVYNNGFYSPWWNFDKKFVAEVYASLGMTDILYPITRSCESQTQFQGHCGKMLVV